MDMDLSEAILPGNPQHPQHLSVFEDSQIYKHAFNPFHWFLFDF